MNALGWFFIVMGNVLTWMMVAMAFTDPNFNTIPYSIAGVIMAFGGLGLTMMDARR